MTRLILNPGIGQGTLQAIPLTIRGVTYPSRTAAARALGVTVGRIRTAIREDTLDTVGSTKDPKMVVKRGKPRVIALNGKIYPNMVAAAKALNVHSNTIRAFVNSNEKRGLKSAFWRGHKLTWLPRNKKKAPDA